jgi:hypothetical protein
MPTIITIPTAALVATFNGITSMNIGNFVASLKSMGAEGDNDSLYTGLALDRIQNALLGLNTALANGVLTASITIPSPPSSLITATRPVGQPLTGALARTPADIAGERVSVFTFGAVGNGTTDDTPAVVAGLAALAAVGGGALYFPGGYTYLLKQIDFSVLPDVPLDLTGDGYGSLIIRNGAITAGTGWFNISSSVTHGARSTQLRFRDLAFDGGVTTATGLVYSGITDPMQTSLSQNSTFWVQSNSNNVVIERCLIQHTGGYAVVLDARTYDVTNIEIANCDFRNNRPHLFGTSAGDENYGSWTGGIHYQMDGVSATSSVKHLNCHDCRWERCTGIGIWGHAYSVTAGYHEDIKRDNLSFTDQGLDAIEIGQELGGTITSPHFRRIGYITTSDSSASTPKWLSGFEAVAIDSTGVNKNITITGAEGVSINGICQSADSICYSTYSGGTWRTPISGDPEYTTDSIAISGPGGAGANWVQGFVTNNSAGQVESATCINHVGNTYINLGGQNCGFYGARYCRSIGNSYYPPAGANAPPAAFGNVGTASYQRAYGNVLRDTFWYSPASPAPCVFEDSTGGAFSSGDYNWCEPLNIFGNGNAYAFERDANTSSLTGTVFATNYAAAAVGSNHYIQREGRASDYSSALKWYLQENTSQWQHVQLQGYWSSGNRGPLLNVSEAGVGGVFSTGARTTSAWVDAMLTGKVYGDGFYALTNTTYSNTDANLLSAVQGGGSTGTAVTALIRYIPTTGFIEQSISISSGTRVWIPITGSGGGSPGGLDTNVQFNDSGAFGGNGNFTFDYTNQIVTITGKTGAGPYAALLVTDTNSPHTAYIESDAGFYSPFNSYQTFKALSGGINTNSASLAGYLGMAQNTSLPALTPGDGWGSGTGVLYLDSSSSPVFWHFTLGTASHTVVDANVWAAGLYATSTSYQTVQAPNGGFYGKSINLTSYVSMAENATLPALTSGDNWFPGSVPTGVFFFDSSSSPLYWHFVQGTASHAVADAFVWSAGLYGSSSNFNAIQTPNGGMYALKGFTADQAFYPKGYSSSASLNTPGGGYGAMGYTGSGLGYWFWNATTSTWVNVNLAASSSGITSINSQTGPAITINTSGSGISASTTTNTVTLSNTGVTSLSAGTAISVSASTGAVTITNTGVTSLSAGTGVTVSASTGAVTVSIGQAVGTGNSPTFASLTITSSASNSINTSGGIDCTSLYASTNAFNAIETAGGFEAQQGGSTSSNILTSGASGGYAVINNNGAFVGNGVNVGSNGIGGAGYNITTTGGSIIDTGYTGTLASAIAAGKGIVGGIVVN